MKCPKCSSEMEKGYVQAVNALAWVKEKRVFSLMPLKDDVILGSNLIGPVALEAYICKECKEVLMSYGNNNKD